jgi:hypothetical protein
MVSMGAAARASSEEMERNSHSSVSELSCWLSSSKAFSPMMMACAAVMKWTHEKSDGARGAGHACHVQAKLEEQMQHAQPPGRSRAWKQEAWDEIPMR